MLSLLTVHISAITFTMKYSMLKNISAKCLYSVPVVAVSTKDPHTELEIAVGHWPFYDQFAPFG